MIQYYSSESVTIPDVRCVRGQCCLSTLWSEDVRGLQGILQENSSEERQVCLSGG